MSAAQWWLSSHTAPSTSAVSFHEVLCAALGGNATENTRYSVVSAAGNMGALRVTLTVAPGGSASRRYQVSVNSTPSTVLDLTISGSSLSGVVTGTVALVAGDIISIKQTPNGSPAAADDFVAISFAPTTTDNFCYPVSTQNFTLTAASIPRFRPALNVSDTNTGTSALGNTRSVAPMAGTITAFYVNVITAPGAAKSWDFILVQNGSEVAATDVNLTGAATTQASVTGLSVSVAAGDTLEWKAKTATGAPTSTSGVSFSFTFVPTTAGLYAMAGQLNTSPSQSANNFGYLLGHTAVSATEATFKWPAPANLTWRSIYVAVTTAPGGGKTMTYKSRVNTADGTIAAVLSNPNTTASDAAHSDNLIVGDLIDFGFSPSGTPSDPGIWAWGLAFSESAAPATAVYTTFGVIQREHDTTKNAATVLYYFESVLATNNASFSAYARLYNVTDGGAVSGSEISTAVTSATRVRSSAITLASGSKTYRAEFGGPTAGGTYTCYAADIIADVST